MRGYASQGYASAPWALAGRVAAVVVVTGCIVETAVYRPGLKSGDTYSGGMKEGQAGC